MTEAREKGEHAPAARIAGGYEAISVTQLLMAWWAYREGLIRKLDLRVWFACWELEIKRRLSEGRYQPSLAELKRLVGNSSEKGQGGLSGSVRRLQALGLLRSCSKKGIAFADSPDELQHEDLSTLFAMLEEVASPGRKIPVPRRIIRRLAGGLSKARTATLLAHLIRCLFYRKGRNSEGRSINPTGCCKASWVAALFGVTERSVHDARGYLIETLGWLRPGDCSQHVLNRDGLWVSINLEWGADARELSDANCRDSVETIPAEANSCDGVARIETTKSGQGALASASQSRGDWPALWAASCLSSRKPVQAPASRSPCPPIARRVLRECAHWSWTITQPAARWCA